MIVWGGNGEDRYRGDVNVLADGGVYDPSTDSWTPINDDILSARSLHSAVWTGKEMIVWGGFGEEVFPRLADGGIYNPSTDSWRAISTVNAPEGKIDHQAIWTGKEMIIWGGTTVVSDGDRNYKYSSSQNGAIYNPDTNTWRRIEDNEQIKTANPVWTGKELLFLGRPSDDDHQWGTWTYGVEANIWSQMVEGPAGWHDGQTPQGFALSNGNMIWTGFEMIVWNGSSGAVYSPPRDSRTRWSSIELSDPIAMTYQTAAVVGDKVYLMEGDAGHLRKKSNVEYDVRTGTSIERTPMSVDVNQLSSVVVDGEIYVIGKLDSGGTSLQKYHPPTDTWTILNSISSTKCWRNWGLVLVGDKLYTSCEYGEYAKNDSLQEYDLLTDRWNEVALTPTRKRYTSLTALDGKIYLIGGGPVNTVDFGDLTKWNKVDIFDPQKGEWSSASPLSLGRGLHSSITVEDKIYVFGGGRADTIHSVEVYDSVSGEWSINESIPSNRALISPVLVDQKIWVIGQPQPYTGPYREIFLFDPFF